jgi:hypothetical protein
MQASRLTDLLDQRLGRLHRLALATPGIVGGDAVLPVSLKAGDQTLDGAQREPEVGSDVVGIGVGAPAEKKSSGGWGQGRHVA